MDYYFIAYIFLCIVFGLTVNMQLFQSGRTWAALFCLVLFILIFIFYGMRWFSNGSVLGTYTGSWPPIINMCPDYLLYFKRGKVDTCVDLVGVNRSGGLLRPWSKGDNPTNPPADDAKYFPYVYKTGMNPSDIQTLCTMAQQAGLTWEGITNGESCTYNPPSTVLGAAAAAAAACPPSSTLPTNNPTITS